ncbi:MAG TPA: hypothetical protein VH062_26175 [Polyangiaceae bacterium]|jgi:hypothetical protein|nr:hypothetical protein [Polyangiaceae bacterium]
MPSSRFRSRFSKPARRASACRWAAILCALVVAVVAPKSARAAGMCDPRGMSVVAPIPALPSITGELTAQKACDSPLQDEMRVGHSQHRTPVAVSAPDAPDRMVVALPGLPRSAGKLIAAPDAATLPDLPGFAGAVYRPPRTR